MDATRRTSGPLPVDHPRQIGRYRIETFLGSGVFGLVYVAHDDEMNRPVAIKVPHPELTRQPEQLAACLAEARQTAAIDHPNIVPVFEVGATADVPCFTVCRFIDGMSLAARMAESRVPHGESAALVATVAGALHAAHLRQVVHGNVQPRNLLLDRHGNVFVTDFSPKRIGRTFAIADKPLTVEQFRAFRPAHALPDRFSNAPNLPAVRIDWYAAAAYCNHLSRLEGIPPEQWCYEDVSAEGRPDVRAKRNLLSLTGYRLPTEAEMEYATRAGSATDRPFGETEELLANYAWFAGNSGGTTHPGGRLKPNDLGLFDTLGNVLEWSQNIYLPDPRDRLHAAANRDDVEDEAELYPGDAFRTVFRAQRGGSFLHSRWESRSATRTNYAVMTDTTDYMGFRVARTLHVMPPEK